MSSSQFSRCKRCGRSLKNPKAQSVGYGAVCLKKHKAEVLQLQKTGQDLGDNGQSSLPYFISYPDILRTPQLVQKKGGSDV